MFALSGMGGRNCDEVKLGQTRNHPSLRGIEIRTRNLITHWAHASVIKATHTADPPQLWASWCRDRHAAGLTVHQALVEDCLARADKGDTTLPDLGTILVVMEEVTGAKPERYRLIPPAELSATVTHVTS